MILQTNLSFVVVPTFKESICKVQISIFFQNHEFPTLNLR
ncbi:hypothetical protein LEP1GSC079_4104 [Leptospira interrogans str. FPW1039]|uniref:Uncharacterized protein n=1 Tax=Leptospira interrogans str. FPW1039 TaxID=1193040 RepID=A0A0F6IKT5_LEPIR|nr:hypothetical protein LEP1GSC079_4104 [Leptospira interrogans str. FPW1039]